MRKLILLLWMCLITTTHVAAQEADSDSWIGKFLRGDHELRQVGSQMVTNASLKGEFFVIVGDMRGQSSQELRVYFSWKGNDGLYNISSLPAENIKINIKDDATTPTIKFRWTKFGRGEDPKTLFENSVLYAVITCQPDIWPPRINMPLSKP